MRATNISRGDGKTQMVMRGCQVSSCAAVSLTVQGADKTVTPELRTPLGGVGGTEREKDGHVTELRVRE